MLSARLTTSRRAFTILEVLVVVLIVTVIALTASPSRSLATSLKRTASEEHLLQLVHTARAQAMAHGKPFGVELDRYLVTRMMMIPSTGAVPVVVGSIAGEDAHDVDGHVPNGLSIASITINGSSLTSTTIWFSELGEPHTRNASGASPAIYTSDALITFSGGRTLRVRAVTGGVNLE